MALTYVGDAHANKDKSKGAGKASGKGAARRDSKAHGHGHLRRQGQSLQQQTGGQAPRNVPLNRTRNLTLKNRPSGRLEPMGRSSLRSKGSSSSSSEKQTKMKTLKNCCRKTVEFMFTQVGVGAVVVFYTLMGASIFQHIETLEEDPSLARVEMFRNETVRSLWNLTHHFNVLNHDRWKSEISNTLMRHELAMVGFVQDEGYDQRTNAERWTFPTALMFALSVITMIGYGAVVPRSDTGKITCIVYACVGIPVYILYFMNMGKVFAAVLKWVYTKAYRWNVRRKWKQSVNYDPMSNTGEDVELDEAYLDELEQQVIVPSTTCLWVMIFYLIAGTVMFAEWEQWNYLDSIYFCVTSLLKIGFGDFVPGAHEALVSVEEENEDQEPGGGHDGGMGKVMSQAKLVMNFVYILVGMGVVAMCYYLLKEEVTVRFNQFKRRMQIRWWRLKMKLGFLSPAEFSARLNNG